MLLTRFLRGAVLCGVGVGCAAAASPQQTASPLAPPPSPAASPPRPELPPGAIAIARGTEVLVAVDTALSSKTAHIGEQFPIRLAEPLRDGGRVVLRAGTAGIGEVVHAAKAGMAGRAGELILTVRYIGCGDTHIPLGHFHLSGVGKDLSKSAAGVNSAVAGASVLAPVAGLGTVIALAIPGGQMVVPAGAQAHAKVTADTILNEEAVARCGGEGEQGEHKG